MCDVDPKPCPYFTDTGSWYMSNGVERFIKNFKPETHIAKNTESGCCGKPVKFIIIEPWQQDTPAFCSECGKLADTYTIKITGENMKDWGYVFGSCTIKEKQIMENEKYYEYLDQLRESGETNMFGAVPYLRKIYPELNKTEARDILKNWMKRGD
ncbi:MAG: hypothetical protein PF495_11720 [Spirochaetales bacterium]|jgi:hypothetical protein|nr:hypothetical protein [Spirochaetales bacterium]